MNVGSNIVVVLIMIIIKTLLILPLRSTAEKVRYLKIEQTGINYINSKFLAYFNHTARRMSRRDPVYYYELHFESRIPLDNKIVIDFYFYEWLTNQYKPTFVEMHFRWCEMIHKDPFFGAPFRQGELVKPCPRPPGAYHLYNMTVPTTAIPRSFPFNKGRIICNLTHAITKEWGAEVYANMELKTMNKNN